MTTQNKKLAILIDADNAPADCIDDMLEEIAKYGTATVKRIYGDWSHGLAKWKAALLPHALIPVQQFAYTKGKNATDMALVIDAMDLLYSNNFDGFCLVSSDSDFTRLASRIRESGLTVYGFGEKKTPESFRKACDKFTYIEIFRPQKAYNQHKNSNNKPKSNENEHNDSTNQVSDLTQLIKRAVKETADDLGWANLGPIGSYISKVSPDFDSRLYGFGKLSDLIKSLDLFEHRTDNNQLQVRRKTDNNKINESKSIESKKTQPENITNLSSSQKETQQQNATTVASNNEITPQKHGRKPKSVANATTVNPITDSKVSGRTNEVTTITLESVISEQAQANNNATGKKRGRKPKNINQEQPEKATVAQPEQTAETPKLSGSQDNNKLKRTRVPFTKLIPLVQQAIAATADQDGWASLTNAAKHLDTLTNPLEHGYADARDIIHQVYTEWVETKKAGRGERVRNNKQFVSKD